MITGLVFGKFMPVHNGHLALIEFARQQCDRLIVSMTISPEDVISPELRLRWLIELLSPYPTIEVVAERNDFHDPTLSLWEATKLWATFIKRRFPNVGVFFSSEEYGAPLAYHSGLQHISFDPTRQTVPVSATLIRQQPARYWDHLPKIVQPYFVKKICLYGPESVGKTTLAEQLAAQYQTVFVPEMARSLITSNNLTADDFIRIGHAQTEAVSDTQQRANRILFCDTDVITTQIYATLYLHDIPPILVELEGQIHYDAYLLLTPDIPWIVDNLRDQGHRRNEMFDRFRYELDRRKLAYQLISGSYVERFVLAQNTVEQVLSDN
jgi:HTH-type transcriptional repressor of NAD biosynthesis genes